MRPTLVLAAALLLGACSLPNYEKDPSLFYAPEDCNNPDKRFHPERVDACGNQR